MGVWDFSQGWVKGVDTPSELCIVFSDFVVGSPMELYEKIASLILVKICSKIIQKMLQIEKCQKV